MSSAEAIYAMVVVGCVLAQIAVGMLRRRK